MRSVAIVGMHRSGTSLGARLCNLLGVELGPADQLVEANEENPEGFWEHRRLLSVNKHVLGRFDGSWDRPPMLPRGYPDRPELDRARTEARAALDELSAAAGDRPFGFKDPRTSLLLEFWRSLGVADGVVCLVRDPLEVASSLHRRDQLPLDHALALWNRYTVAVLARAPEAMLVLHRDLFTAHEQVVTELGRHLDLPVTDEVLGRARSAIRPDLYRSRPAAPPTTPTGAFARWLYDLLAAGERPPTALLLALDDAYNGRHLGLDSPEPAELQVVPLERVDRLRASAKRHRRRADQREGELAAAEAAIERLQHELDAVRGSRTWRVGRLLTAGPAAVRRRWGR